MLSHTRTMKRRVAAAAISALGVFVACLIGIRASIEIQMAASAPEIALEALAQQLRTSVLPGATSPFISDAQDGAVMDGGASAYQQVLDRIVAVQRDVVAAVVVDRNLRIIAAAPGRDQLVGRVIMPVVPQGQPFAPPGPAGFGGPAGGPMGSGGPPGYAPGSPPGADDAGGPLGGPATADRSPFPDPVQLRLGGMLRRAYPGGLPHIQAGLRSTTLFIAQNQMVSELYVLPRLNQSLYGFASSTLEPACIVGAFVSFPIYWLMLPWWVYLDARWRTGKAVPLSLFVLLTNFLGWLTYLVIRPEGNQTCPVCVSLLEPSFRACPHCGWSRAIRCRQCTRALRSDWRFCPYCEAPRAEGAPAGDPLE